jgi:predicted ATPase with chaperone activity
VSYEERQMSEAAACTVEPRNNNDTSKLLLNSFLRNIDIHIQMSTHSFKQACILYLYEYF